VSSDGSTTTREAAQALIRRFASRVEPGRRGHLGEVARALAEAHPSESTLQLAGRLAARLPAQVAAREVDVGGEAPLLGLDRRLRELPALRPLFPRELLDGRALPRPLSPLDYPTVVGWWREYLARRASGRAPALLQLYVHVPYCVTRCGFCQCDSLPLRHRGEIDAFLEEILAEAGAFAADLGALEVQAATLGGGTPSRLDEDALRRLLDGIVGRVFRLAPDGYFSAEMNPDSTTEGKLSALVAAGVNRVSFGVQSLHPETLRAVQRGYQTAAQVVEAFTLAHRHPSLQLGLDLIAPLPEETARSFREGARRALALGPHEAVLYSYQPVVRRGRAVEAGLLPWQTAREIFSEESERAGYVPIAQGGPSAVVKRRDARSFPSRYHQHSLEPSSLLGLGPFAQSHVFGAGEYRRAGPGAGPKPYSGGPFTLEEEASSFVRRRIAERAALDDEAFRAAFGAGLSSRWAAELAFLLEEGVLRPDGADRLLPHLDGEESALRASWLFLGPAAAGELRRRHLAARAPPVGADELVSWLSGVDSTRGARLAAALRAEAGAPLRWRGADLTVQALPAGEGGEPAACDLRLCADIVLEEALPGDDDQALAEAILRNAEQLRGRPASERDRRTVALAARLLAAGQARSLRVCAASRASGEPALELDLAVAAGSSRPVLGALLRTTGAEDSCVPTASAWDLVEEVGISLGAAEAPATQLRWRIEPRRSRHLRDLATHHRALAAALSGARHAQVQSALGGRAPLRICFHALAGEAAREVLRIFEGAAPGPRTRWPLQSLPAASVLAGAELPCRGDGLEPSQAALRFALSSPRRLVNAERA
jgi:coproporphyrinogen III oxidase-like Fe-S oxidoreductase